MRSTIATPLRGVADKQRHRGHVGARWRHHAAHGRASRGVAIGMALSLPPTAKRCTRPCQSPAHAVSPSGPKATPYSQSPAAGEQRTRDRLGGQIGMRQRRDRARGRRLRVPARRRDHDHAVPRQGPGGAKIDIDQDGNVVGMF